MCNIQEFKAQRARFIVNKRLFLVKHVVGNNPAWLVINLFILV
jgi:hypothetical protein